jgi:D-alanine-D-alanine ligase
MKTIGLFFGGMGSEAEISVKSATNIIENFDYKKYNLVLVFWNKNGKFYKVSNLKEIKKLTDKSNFKIEDFSKTFNIALLMTHGRYGEDGILQSILESQKVKYCGCRVFASALCMDKAFFKTYLSKQNILQVKFKILDFNAMDDEAINKTITEIKNNFKLPLYIKPSNSGSSIGIARIEKMEKIQDAITAAKKFDQRIIIEEGLQNPREIEVGICGNKKLIISEPGELNLAKEFYSYDDKYKLNQTGITIPAALTKKQITEIKKTAEKVYRLCGLNGFARIDFFLIKNKIYLNEINTLPGFTNISMFPQLIMKTGISYQELINKIIELAF